MLMYYVNCYTFFEEPEKDWARILVCDKNEPPEPSLFEQGIIFFKLNPQRLFMGIADITIVICCLVYNIYKLLELTLNNLGEMV